MNINSFNEIKSLDTGFVSESIDSLPFQIEQVIQDAKNLKIPDDYKNITQVVVSGMGGSNLGAGIIKSAMSEYLKVPLSIIAGYNVPSHVNEHTLYISSSYSGTTEETLYTYKQAKKQGAKMLIITAGGNLGEIMEAENIPGFIINPTNNPSNQPRLALGYSIFGMLMLMSKAGLFEINKEETATIIKKLKKWNDLLTIKSQTPDNTAKVISEKMHNKQIIFVGSEFLTGNIRAMRNQTCENAKNFASYLILPDLNHFAMEGLTYPLTNKETIHFLFLNSHLYHPRIQKRNELTKKIVEKNKIQYSEITLTGTTKFEQAFETLQIGTWITYYLGILNEINPSEIPWVDLFKKELA